MTNSAPPPLKRISSFKGDVIRLASGTGIAQVIALCATPVLTRLYAPDTFGVAALFASLVAIISVVACLRYELSIVLPDSDREAANLLAVSLVIAILIALFAAVSVWLGSHFLARWDRMAVVAPYLWFVPLAVLIQGFFTALNFWNTRTRQFSRLSVARVSSSLANATGSIGAGITGNATSGAMIAAQVGGQAVATTVLGGQIWRDNGAFLSDNITWREMWSGAKRHSKFPVYGSLSALMNSVSWQLPVLVLGMFFSPAIAGFYTLGFRILQLPLNLIGSAISQVFFQRAAQAKEEGTLAPLVEQLLHRLVSILLLPMLVLTVVGRDLYVLVFGENWAEAGVYTQILAIWGFFWFISSPLSTLFSVLEKQEFGLKFNSVLLLTRVASLGIGGVLGDARAALWLFALTGSLVYGYLCISITMHAGLPSRRVWQILKMELVRAVPFGGIVLAVHLLQMGCIVNVIVSSVTVLYFYYRVAMDYKKSKRQPEKQ